jgi:hypothetical protein
MKFLLFTLLFISAYAYSSAQAVPSVEELTRRAQALLQFASNEIKYLRAQNKTLEADGLEQEEKRLLELEVELRAAATSGTGDVVRLKERLDTAEETIGNQLRALGRDFVSDREKNEILRRAQEILNAATAAIIHLRAENRTLEAEGLVEQEKVLIELDIELRAARDPGSIRRLENMLRGIETLVNNELRRLGRSLKKRDLKSDLITRAKALITTAEAEVKQLTAENRTAAADLVSREIKNVTALEEELQKATAEADIRQLEQRLIQQEIRLVEDLRRVGRPISSDELKESLIFRATGLVVMANEEIRVLKNENRTDAVTRVQAEEKAITDLITELKAATTETAVRDVEGRLTLAMAKLFVDLQASGGPLNFQRDLERVIRRAEELAIRATIEIRKLREQGKELLSAGLQREEQYLLELDVELRAATTPEQIRRIEERLNETEARVNQELKQLGVSRTRRDLKDDLIKRAADLETRANAEVKTLRSQNRTNAADLIEREEKLIQQLVVELKNTTQEPDLRRLEERLGEREFRLAEDLRRLGRPTNPTDLKEVLIRAGEAFVARAEAEIKVLQSQNLTQAVAVVQKLEKDVTDLVAVLRNATAEADIQKAEQSLSLAEFTLEEELRQLGRPQIDVERLRLIGRAEEIAVRATIEIRKLREEGKPLLAAGLEREERYLVELDVELRTATTPEQIKRLEGRIDEAEKRVVDELKRLGVTY